MSIIQSDVLQQLAVAGIVPVVVIDDAEKAVPLAQALIAGGLPVAEVTFRTAAAEEAIRRISQNVPEILLGAGTVLTIEQAQRAIDAGARYIVSPGLNPDVVRFCQSKGVPITPGCSNPTDIEMAMGLGLDVVKFFPAEAFGGLATLKAIAAPYGKVKFIPTGGIDATNINDYLAFNKVLACGGSWMVKAELIKENKFDEITRLTREAVTTMLGFSLAHVGINADSEETSKRIADAFAGMFGLTPKYGNSSNFAGSIIEVMKSTGPGAHGHLAIRTNSIPRAIAYLQRLGIAVDMASAKGPEGGAIVAVYLQEPVGGFAIHLLQK